MNEPSDIVGEILLDMYKSIQKMTNKELEKKCRGCTTAELDSMRLSIKSGNSKEYIEEAIRCDYPLMKIAEDLNLFDQPQA